LALTAWTISLIIQLLIHSTPFIEKSKKEKYSSIVFRKISLFILIDCNPFWNLRLIGERPPKEAFKSPKIVVVAHIKIRIKFVKIENKKFNHKSNIDAVLVARFIPPEVRYIAKHVLFKFPIGGTNMTLAGDIPVVLKNKNGTFYVEEKDKIKLTDRSVKFLENGGSLVIFPEGKRIRTNELGKFKDGAFIFAQKSGADI
ncbi:hypothetical protein MHBO_004692, partial [Bonamia ostreae]